MIIFDIIIYIYLLIKFILKYFYNKLSINYFLFFILWGIGDWGLGIGDWGFGGGGPAPNPTPPTPKTHTQKKFFLKNKF